MTLHGPDAEYRSLTVIPGTNCENMQGKLTTPSCPKVDENGPVSVDLIEARPSAERLTCATTWQLSVTHDLLEFMEARDGLDFAHSEMI